MIIQENYEAKTVKTKRKRMRENILVFLTYKNKSIENRVKKEIIYGIMENYTKQSKKIAADQKFLLTIGKILFYIV